jgi:uncharacterized protein YdeI (YjbR/CyaY-like superfamily)
VARLDDAERVHPADRAEWRAWLVAHHAASSGVWLVSRTRASGGSQLPYEDIVEELLCFGWIDSTTRKLDADHTMMYVAPRKKGGTWAATNKARVERLTAAGLMTDAGLRAVERAREDGSWTALDAVEALEIPADLQDAFRDHPRARAAYDLLSAGRQKQVLWSVVSAKREQTRAARITAIVDRAEAGEPLVR